MPVSSWEIAEAEVLQLIIAVDEGGALKIRLHNLLDIEDVLRIFEEAQPLHIKRRETLDEHVRWLVVEVRKGIEPPGNLKHTLQHHVVEVREQIATALQQIEELGHKGWPLFSPDIRVLVAQEDIDGAVVVVAKDGVEIVF
ncbi:hypothetical protein [Mesorhizobium sp.]|uniref:hypothetical protein n=1 Tax=Mesorhizobium sp. TaxID=1871066 RepID=UPI000FE96F18|nr:hypothetical protein [Mesorhizobium sp.]RWK65601.1 MAG: hypothetical protein EOR49_00380 [Mesorhizobium sp.]RWM53819.1 MAG: hypothetical protein EOR76_01025 [Mesorhizobium sp.]RWM54633.1 MAG: hypothetical protein EOR79_24190 [Mesorhizobium sp.]RWM60813.1 MAG: hypothetical protein EOR78_02465 [Mesorhizobium sp.]RWM95192.1 MAG: hypothetical protein EOR85_24620 [Mesorhizobium sp.]